MLATVAILPCCDSERLTDQHEGMVRAVVILAAVSALTLAGIVAIHVNQQTERQVLSAKYTGYLETSACTDRRCCTESAPRSAARS